MRSCYNGRNVWDQNYFGNICAILWFFGCCWWWWHGKDQWWKRWKWLQIIGVDFSRLFIIVLQSIHYPSIHPSIDCLATIPARWSSTSIVDEQPTNLNYSLVQSCQQWTVAKSNLRLTTLREGISNDQWSLMIIEFVWFFVFFCPRASLAGHSISTDPLTLQGIGYADCLYKATSKSFWFLKSSYTQCSKPLTLTRKVPTNRQGTAIVTAINRNICILSTIFPASSCSR